MSDIFISYAREDVGRVKPLAEALESEGWSVWWDPLIMPGRRFDLIIAGALESARSVIVVWSKRSVHSAWVLDEAREGAEREILLPLLIEDVRIPLGFGRLQTVNMVNWQGELPDSNFDRLKHALVTLMGGPPLPAEQKVPTTILKSPILGTFYRGPWPASKPFVEVGDQVEADTAVCIIETMGLMSEIQAETKGRILKIYAENGQLVEWDQPLFEISDFPPPANAEQELPAATEPELPEAQLHAILSPFGGTFYRGPSPASEPFVKVGDQVEPDTVVCIIQAWELMNEIQTDFSGKIVKIYAENGQSVQWDEPLFEISDFPPPANAEPELPVATEPELPEAQLHIIQSPIVGRFYRAASPASGPFVRVGDQIEPDSVVCIIEAMRLMNEIIAETSGKIVRIYVENGQPVEYGQPLFGVIESHQH